MTSTLPTPGFCSHCLRKDTDGPVATGLQRHQQILRQHRGPQIGGAEPVCCAGRVSVAGGSLRVKNHRSGLKQDAGLIRTVMPKLVLAISVEYVRAPPPGPFTPRLEFLLSIV